MSWWAWLLVSIGGYIGVGFTVGCVAAFNEGVDDSKHDDGILRELDILNAALCIPFWPLYVTGVLIPQVFKVCYRRGKSRANRKLIRQGKKAQNKAFKDLCKQNGWDYKKMRGARELIEP